MVPRFPCIVLQITLYLWGPGQFSICHLKDKICRVILNIKEFRRVLGYLLCKSCPVHVVHHSAKIWVFSNLQLKYLSTQVTLRKKFYIKNNHMELIFQMTYRKLTRTTDIKSYLHKYERKSWHNFFGITLYIIHCIYFKITRPEPNPTWPKCINYLWIQIILLIWRPMKCQL